MAGDVWREMCGGRCVAGVILGPRIYASGRKFIFGSILEKNVSTENFKFRIGILGFAPLRDRVILGARISASGRKFIF